MAETSESSKTGDGSKDKEENENKPAFEPKKGKVVEHTKYGVWDLYQERDRSLSYLPTSLNIEGYREMWNDLPYLWKTIRDLSSVAWPTLSLYLVLTLARSLLPALTLWCVRKLLLLLTRGTTAFKAHCVVFRYSGQLLDIVSL
jgi:hypothetical protein